MKRPKKEADALKYGAFYGQPKTLRGGLVSSR